MKRASMYAAIAAAFVTALVSACSDGASGPLTLGHGTWGGGGGAMDDAAPSDDAGATTDAGTTSDAATTDAATAGDAAHDSSTVAPPDSGAPRDASPQTDAAANAFSGTGGWASAPPALFAQAQHGFSLAGRNCADCHGGTSPSSGKRFDFAGRVFADPNGTTPAADVEVRVVDHNGVGTSVHSDADGYFWHLASADLAIPAMAGARNGSATSLMVGALSDPVKRGGCNGCHNGTTTTHLHVP